MADDILWDFAMYYTGDLDKNLADFKEEELKRLLPHKRAFFKLVLRCVNNENINDLTRAVIHDKRTSDLFQIVFKKS